MDNLVMILGYVGILLLLGGYFMLLMGHVKVTDTKHVMMNILGSLLIVIALMSNVVLPLTYVVMVWLLISVLGWVKHSTTTS
jgi:hypothetical protein